MMANSKLPHERMRDWADIAERKGTFPSTLMDEELGEGFGKNLKHCDCVAFRRLADEVERYYIPRPRYENGEPLSRGDEFVEESGDVLKAVWFGFLPRDDGDSMIRIVCHDNSWYDLGVTERLKRPAPKVLDADGVPIEVGDWVYTEAGMRRKVAKVGTERCLGMEDWDGSPWVMFGNGSWMHAHDITHREPDSLEKLRDDMRGYADGGVSCIEDDMRMFADRLTALIERGAE